MAGASKQINDLPSRTRRPAYNKRVLTSAGPNRGAQGRAYLLGGPDEPLERLGGRFGEIHGVDTLAALGNLL